jgi:hypothetical protein
MLRRRGNATMRKLVTVALLLMLTFSMYAFAAPVNADQTSLPKYEEVPYGSRLAGDIVEPSIGYSQDSSNGIQDISEFQSTPAVGTKAFDWYLWAISVGSATDEQPWMTLRAVSQNVEIWVQDYPWFQPGDPRNAEPYDFMITDAMCQYLADQFNSVIYPKDTSCFGVPHDRNGTNTIFEQYGYPSYYWDWIATNNSQRVIVKILNYRDWNYYDWTYPYYVSGFFYREFDDYYNRNMITMDIWRMWEKLGPAGNQWFSERPDLVVSRPHLEEAGIAHEFQHLIHSDYQRYSEIFMDEGCAMYAMILCGYGLASSYINSFFATPDNSLTAWSDQGDINTIADYGAVALWTTYLADHYGGPDLLRYYVQSGITGIDGINNALAHLGYKETFYDVFRYWRLANLIHSDFPGCGKYNYKSIDLNSPEIIPVRMYEVNGLPVQETSGTDFGNSITILGYDTGRSKIGPLGTDYIALKHWNRAGLISFDGDDSITFVWTQTSEGWWSQGENFMNILLVGQAHVDPANPTLTLVTKYMIDPYYDYGFVQVSTDGGKTWKSLQNWYTSDYHDPEARPQIVDNLPGLTAFSWYWPDWTTMTFDLSVYSGQNVMIGFRYVTDWWYTYDGWYINEADVSGVKLALTPIYPDVNFQVTLVQAIVTSKQTYYIPWDMRLNDTTETGFGLGFAIRDTYVILVVSPITDQGFVDYRFSVNSLYFCHGSQQLVGF